MLIIRDFKTDELELVNNRKENIIKQHIIKGSHRWAANRNSMALLGIRRMLVKGELR